MRRDLFEAIVLLAMFGGEIPTRRDTPVVDEKEDFHAHLRRCTQCAKHPFALCTTGARLLERDAIEVQQVQEETPKETPPCM